MNKVIYNFLKVLPDKMYLQLLYYKHFHKFINFKNPKTFNEKINWLKIYDRRSEYTQMVDKYAVREYIAKRLGEEYLIPLLGVWDDPHDIDFDTLSDQFVLKWNHDSGSVVICKDKAKLNISKTVEMLASKKSHNGFWYAREWPYKNVKPKVIAEKYMVDESGYELKGYNGSLIDYKFYCFQGVPRYLYVSSGLHDHATASISFLTMDWEFAPFGRSDFKPFDTLPAKPSLFDEMKLIAERLAKGHDFLRVDLYQVNGKIYFSELTFSPCAGLMPFVPKEWDNKLGEMLVLTKLKKGG